MNYVTELISDWTEVEGLKWKKLSKLISCFKYKNVRKYPLEKRSYDPPYNESAEIKPTNVQSVFWLEAFDSLRQLNMNSDTDQTRCKSLYFMWMCSDSTTARGHRLLPLKLLTPLFKAERPNRGLLQTPLICKSTTKSCRAAELLSSQASGPEPD